ncbi:GrBNV_gp37-like protein [Drosophila innubila nudivirus]|uniref:GrBNV_gp37-like protein n=1 Tax=Drosophila innubila nudivirus TaxID=2057187 RepID=A0A2H4UXB6_9VIRU|nr:GrBNV_gp37-like protein [Drosophila innubila nudivirus]ATZ81561.1 GrBNV_gp37-like protein [Drosophila innubila nudivirus]
MDPGMKNDMEPGTGVKTTSYNVKNDDSTSNENIKVSDTEQPKILEINTNDNANDANNNSVDVSHENVKTVESVVSTNVVGNETAVIAEKDKNVAETNNHVYANVKIVVKPDIIFDTNDKNDKNEAYTMCVDHSDDEDGTPDDDDDHNQHHHDDEDDDDDDDCGSSNNGRPTSNQVISKDLRVEDFVFVEERTLVNDTHQNPNNMDTSQTNKPTTEDVIINPIDIVRTENQRLSQTMVNNGLTMFTAPLTAPPPTSSSSSNSITSIHSQNIQNSTNGNINMESRKRKAPTMSISLLQFVHLLFEIRAEMIINVETRKISFNRSISSYVENCSATKYLKFDDISKNSGTETHTEQFNSKVYNCVINKLFIWFESQNATFLFPKEMLRYFLSTYLGFIKPSDFIDTNSIQKVDKRGKNIAQLMNGGILYEYAKGFDIFISSMSRSDLGDIQALKFIVEKRINIPSDTYELALNIKFSPKPHTQDSEYKHRPDYSQIMITNNKQMFVLITKNIVMIYDGNIFVAPTTNTEREFTVSMRENSKLGDTDYILLDIMFAVKIRVIDVLQCNINGNTKLPELYSERLDFIQKMVPDLRLATISPQKLSNDCSYIHKPNSGFGPSYIYYKSNLTAAAVGVVDKNVILAFHDRNEKTLVIKTKVSISGPVSYMIAIMPTVAQSDGPTILLDDIPTRIVGDIKDARIFKNVIPIELKDLNRLSIYSVRPISDVADYKPNAVRKESAILDDIHKQINLNPDLLTQILMKIATAPNMTLNDESRNIIRNILDPKFDISFDGYNNLT